MLFCVVFLLPLQRRKVPRTLFIFFDTLLTAVNFVVLMLSSIDTLYIPRHGGRPRLWGQLGPRAHRHL